MARPKHTALLTTVIILSSLAINACGAQSSPTPTLESTAAPTSTPLNATPTQLATSTPQSTEAPQPTPAPAFSPTPLTPTDLKYILLGKYASANNLLFCDPDMYPISVSQDEVLKRAEAKLTEIQSNQEVFQAILKYNDLTATTDLTDGQKLLIYSDYKQLNTITMEPANDKYKFAIQVGKAPDVTEGAGTKIEGLIDQNGAITNETKQDVQVQCPVCLAGNTQIDTPNGPISVKDLRLGMSVWTLDSYGIRRAATILKTTKRTVATPHEMLHVVLSDGRELVASPRHPTMSGQLIGSLNPGDTLDNSLIVKAEYIPSSEDATYDILPSGATGFYWANDILLASTLAPPPKPDGVCQVGHLKDQP